MAEDRSLSTDLILSRLVADLADSARQLAQVTSRAEQAEAACAALQGEIEPLRARNREVWSNPESWMKWCDARTLERAEHAEAQCAVLRVTLEQFLDYCQKIRNGSPNWFYAYIDAFCKDVRALLLNTLTAPPQEP